MQNDEIIWQVINHHFCSYKAKLAKEKTFCRNPYNVTGICNRSSCPLANSKYATIREHNGRMYLYMKTIERAHTPNRLWERIKLSMNYAKALEQVDEQLEFFPKSQIHRNKQRLTKIYQYLIRARKLELKTKPKIVTVNKQQEKLEGRREEKALKAAQLESSIKKELMERLKSGTYGDIYNFPEIQYNEILDETQKEDDEAEELMAAEDAEQEQLEEDDEVGDLEEYEFEDDDDVGAVEFVADEDDEDEEDALLSQPTQKKRKPTESKPKKKPKSTKPFVEIEYEDEEEEEQRLGW